MDRWTLIGIVILVAGLLVLAGGASGFSREVLARETVMTNDEYQTLGPVSLPGGSISIWFEDHPDLPDAWDIDLYLTDLAEEESWWVDTSWERRSSDIEGVRCFMVGQVFTVPEGEFLLEVEFYDNFWGGPSEDAAVFFLASVGPMEGSLLILGSLTAFVGAVVVAVRKWPMRQAVPSQAY